MISNNTARTRKPATAAPASNNTIRGCRYRRYRRARCSRDGRERAGDRATVVEDAAAATGHRHRRHHRRNKPLLALPQLPPAAVLFVIENRIERQRRAGRVEHAAAATATGCP